MAQITDVIHALTIFDAARQELAWAYTGNFTDVPEHMKGAVHRISEVLNETEMVWVTTTEAQGLDTQLIGEAESQSIRDWLMRLKDVAYDMRAVAHKELLQDSRIHDKLSSGCLPCLPRTTRSTRITPTIDSVSEKLEELKKQYEGFKYNTGLPLATYTQQPFVGDCEESTVSEVLVAKDDDKQRIINIISDYSKYIIPIVGPPCVGKTTLVKSVFHDPRFHDYIKVWVDLQKGSDIEKIYASIWKASTESLPDDDNDDDDDDDDDSYWVCREDVSEELQRQNKSLLLVLDDMGGLDCSQNNPGSMFSELCGFLLGDDISRGIVILVTPSEDTAEHITMKTVKPYRLHPLSDDMCWEIIKRTSGLTARTAGNQEETAAVSDMIGREIASKCSGIPLAAKAIGCFLQSVNPRDWPGAREDLDIWNISEGFSRDSQLPLHSITLFTHLKRSSHLGHESWFSFAYCAFIFPINAKGRSMVTHDMLNQWCSLGITTRQRGKACISELLDRSLLQGKPASNVSSFHYEKDVDDIARTLLTMDNLMHEFARYLLGDRLIVVDGRNVATQPCSYVNKSSSAYLALVRNLDAKQLELDIPSILPAGILGLRFEDCREIELSDGAFAFAKHLRLLDLSGCSLKTLPDSIRHLKQLRYLKAPRAQDEVFPRTITGLHELRYLNLNGSFLLSDLTEAFERLSNLLHLCLSGCLRLNALPESFGMLWRLEHLDLSACSGMEALPDSFCWLPNLRHLDLAGCSGLKALPDSFERLQRLEHLDLSACSGIEALPRLPQVKHLDLAGCSGLKALSESFHAAHWWLLHLDLSGCSALKALPKQLLEFTRLRRLHLSGFSELQVLPMEMPEQLWLLDLSGCSRLKALPASISEFDELRHLNLSGCSSLTRFPKLKFTDILVHLDLSGCSKLTRLPDNKGFGSLQYLDLSGCFQLQVPRGLVENIRRRGGAASGPGDPILKLIEQPQSSAAPEPEITEDEAMANVVSQLGALSQNVGSDIGACRENVGLQAGASGGFSLGWCSERESVAQGNRRRRVKVVRTKGKGRGAGNNGQ